MEWFSHTMMMMVAELWARGRNQRPYHQTNHLHYSRSKVCFEWLPVLMLTLFCLEVTRFCLVEISENLFFSLINNESYCQKIKSYITGTRINKMNCIPRWILLYTYYLYRYCTSIKKSIPYLFYTNKK